MKAPHVFAAATVMVFVAVAMVSVGVALIAGLGWALVVCGAQLAAVAVGGAFALLHEGDET